ncbi:Putative glutathione-specific gamma-glutamylcyclotransferase 2 [Galdieria sulphuraria]|uniref:glutathione-specific gamma-glutamylcyclotransferase n=1 Tax=Galdieria sulphuraria TaxID=130081 RepID=M2W8B4_GALSU|nr:cation transport protein ChaC [Galdieria sulphuraria]EME32116.1 cation transport protein ChaC [Galdieria sulphuraria]GJD06643.1 Putative glutathione-specific gamma-glutamylcyclotransferase 2 [Galdieria sulphuraria]|eukprot:XP_005708636.1 cation transport protein ChaC [Galdieria sulphuraria]
MTTDQEEDGTWIFGYGSLIWKAEFPYVKSIRGCVKGWCRRFWQGSIDHRGTQDAPGRVVTLVPAETVRSMGQAYTDESFVTWGVGYLIKKAEVEKVLQYLDYREKNGYSKVLVDIYEKEDAELPVVRDALIYIASETNRQWLGPSDEKVMIEHIFKSRGPSGSNREYFEKLVDSMRSFGIYDAHLESLTSVAQQQIETAFQ